MVRQLDEERTSAAVEAISNAHRTSEPRCGCANYRQAKPGSLHFVVAAAIKPLEHLVPILYRYPRAIIRDTQRPTLAHGGQRYNNATAIVSIPNGVIDQVTDDRTKRVKLDGFVEIFWGVEHQVDSFGNRRRCDCREFISDERYNVTQRHFARAERR